MNRPFTRRAGPLFGVVLVVTGMLGAVSPVIPAAPALDPSAAPSESAEPSPAPRPRPGDAPAPADARAHGDTGAPADARAVGARIAFPVARARAVAVGRARIAFPVVPARDAGAPGAPAPARALIRARRLNRRASPEPSASAEPSTDPSAEPSTDPVGRALALRQPDAGRAARRSCVGRDAQHPAPSWPAATSTRRSGRPAVHGLRGPLPGRERRGRRCDGQPELQVAGADGGWAPVPQVDPVVGEPFYAAADAARGSRLAGPRSTPPGCGSQPATIRRRRPCPASPVPARTRSPRSTCRPTASPRSSSPSVRRSTPHGRRATGSAWSTAPPRCRTRVRR